MAINMLIPWNRFPAGYTGPGRSTEEEDWLIDIGLAVRVTEVEPDKSADKDSQTQTETKLLGPPD